MIYFRRMSAPLVHVIVINWNGLEHIDACFETLLESTYPNVRFVLLDNGSTDGSVARVRERFGGDSRVELVETGANLGWSGGNNVGIRRALDANADYVFLLNNDTAISPDAIERLVADAEAGETIGALAPKMVLFDQPDILNSLGVECSIIGNGWDRGLGRLDRPKWDTPTETLGVCGGAMFIRAAALERAGLLPEDFGIYLDDLDLSMRIWNAGYCIRTCPAARVRHKFSATMGEGKRARQKYYLNTRNRFRLVLRNFPTRHAPMVVSALIHGEIKAVGRAVLDGEYWRVPAHVRAWLSALAYLPKAIIERIQRKTRGYGTCKFWQMIRRDTLYFRGMELPDAGWYAARDVAGARLRPIAGRAESKAAANRLRISHANAYPELGATDVSLECEGHARVTLSTQSRDEYRIEDAAGRLLFVANRIFDADDTGELADFGGWLRVEPE
jgi:GT2 family glycosyltransferase